VIFRFTDSLGNDWAIHRHGRVPHLVVIEVERKGIPEAPVYAAIPPEDVPRLVGALTWVAKQDGGEK
jgi:hypothetical protein